MIRVASTGTAPEQWDGFVRDAGDSTVMHLHGWKTALEGAYGLRTWFLSAFDADELRGVLPLTLVTSPLLGRSLVSMPFMDYGGACVAGHEKAEGALVDAARSLADEHRARLVLRYARPADLALPCSLEKVTMVVPLPSSEDAVWKRLPGERRNRIRKAMKAGLTSSLHGADGLDDFYRVFAENMRDLGSPVHSARFFRDVVAALGPHTRIIVVRDGRRPVGAGLMLVHNGTISMPWVSSLRSAFHMSPNQMLYWGALCFGVAEGHTTFDFGRSSRDSGTFEAKRQWGAEPVQLYWYYHPEAAGPPGEDVKRLGLAARAWRRLPLAIANRVGPWLRRGIPN
jgi:serine/alanine adding enzyme